MLLLTSLIIIITITCVLTLLIGSITCCYTHELNNELCYVTTMFPVFFSSTFWSLCQAISENRHCHCYQFHWNIRLMNLCNSLPLFTLVRYRETGRISKGVLQMDEIKAILYCSSRDSIDFMSHLDPQTPVVPI